MSTLRLIAAAALLAASSSSFAVLTVYHATLAPEAAGATGSGNATFTYDSVANDLRITFDFTGLSGPSTVAHIHCCTPTAFGGTAAVAVTPGTLPNFPVGVTSGSYDEVIDLDVLTSFTQSFRDANGGLAGARDKLLGAMANGFAYLNVHSETFRSGEIRGFITVPEPTSFALAGLALAGIGLSRRARRG